MQASPELGTRARVFVVDDSRLEAEAIVGALDGAYEVQVFTDGSALLERIAEGSVPDVLVLDWVMPGVSGLDVIQFLRSEPRTESLEILVVTSRQDVEGIVAALRAGANDYLKKPYSPAELSARVGALLRTRSFRERAERAEASVRRLLAHLPDAVVTVDAEDAVALVNIEAELMVGRPAAELVGKRVADLLPGLAMDLLAGATADRPIPLPDIRLGGRTYAPSARRLPDDDRNGRYTIAFRDVTHERRLEARRLDFYAVVAHDLRAPLAAMMLRIDLMLRGVRGELPPDLTRDVRILAQRIGELLALVDDFLELANLEVDGFAVERKPFDLAELAADTVDDFRLLARSQGVELSADLGEGKVELPGDRRRLRQVLTNLLANAIKFTPSGGQVRLRIEPGPEAVLGVVDDTGIGVAPDLLPELFQRHVRTVGPRNEQGSGLGLMIVRQVVEAHGGAVGAESTLGKGSRFWFRLPRTS